jgi:WD40 repeat protein/serine/threonine protein kinase
MLKISFSTAVPSPSTDEFLIAHLFDLPAADRVAAWQQACARDQTLAARHPEVARLFSRHIEPVRPLPPDAMVGLLESALGQSGNTGSGAKNSSLNVAEHEAPGVRIGHYKLLQKIGEGGFGAVWMAEQLEPIRRRVAMKIVKVGMDTEEVIARFEVERQALALMDHPNIARVFDAGATASGRPYFVMELVRGVAITRYCDDNRLAAADRLRLFVAVCQAVQHAHQKGVIHRDLKPSNILVTVHDGTPVPKVIDFGIAKATDKQLTAKTLVTQFHAFVGTPAYTSPEQMEMSGLDVDTRSDIYSLGVLLYELLAGRPPFDPDALVKSGLEAMRRTIREIDPPRPSHRLGTLNEVDRTSVAHARSTDATKLSVLLRGDVDWIVMHCLEKDRTRRYETANALARDVLRHLAHEPISARPPSSLYQLQKLYRRHKLGVIATAAITLSIVCGLIVSSSLFVSEHSARQRAVSAERTAEQLRQQAEAGRAAEALRASRTSLAHAEQLLAEEGRGAEGVAQLVRAAKSDPGNTDIGARIIATLAYRNFAEPVGTPLRHPTPLWRAFYTRNGQRCVTVGQDGVIRVWDLRGGTVLHTLPATVPIFANVNLIAVDLSPDGSHFLTGDSEGNVNLWNLESGLRILGPLRHAERISSVQFSADARMLATASDDRKARVWDAATGSLVVDLPHDFRVRNVRFSPDGTRLVTTTWRGPWKIWRLPDGKPLTLDGWAPAPGAFPAAIGVDFSPDGTLIAIADNGGAQLFNAFDGTKVGSHLTHTGPCYAAVFTPDGKKVVTTSDDATARIWEVPTGRQLFSNLVHGSRVHPPLLAPNSNHLITRSDDGLVRVWDVTTGRLAMEPIHGTDGRSVDVSPDGSELLTTGSDGTVRRWGRRNGGAVPFQLPDDPGRFRVLGASSDTTDGWSVYPDRMQRINLLTAQPLEEPRRFPARISASVLSQNSNHLAVILEDGNHVELWNLNGNDIKRRPLGELPLAGVRFSPDGSHMLTYEATESVRIWDTATGSLVAGPIREIDRYISFSPDSRRVALSTLDNAVTVWDLPSNRQVGRSIVHRSVVQGVQFSPDGRRLATASQDGIAQIWDTETMQPAGPPLVHRSLLRNMVFTSDSRRLVTWTPAETRVWDVNTGAALTDPLVGGMDIYIATVTKDDTRIATWSRTSRDVRLWSLHSGQLLADPVTIPGSVSAAEFKAIASGRFLSIAAQRGNVVWPVPPSSEKTPVPPWLLKLATTFAGGEVDARAVFREQAFEMTHFDELRRELAALPDSAPYVEWGRWILADRTTRPIAPGLAITTSDVARMRALAPPATGMGKP